MRSQYSYQVFFLIPLMFVVLLILLPLPLPPPLPLPLPLLPLSLPLEFAGVSSAALPVIVRTLDAWRRSQATCTAIGDTIAECRSVIRVHAIAEPVHRSTCNQQRSPHSTRTCKADTHGE